jgi:hypothetical protein
MRALRTLFMLTLAGAAFGLTACGWQPREPAVINSAAYQEGHAAGCAAAGRQTPSQTDPNQRVANRTETDPNFAAGYRDGFLACGGNPVVDEERYIGTTGVRY